MTYSMLFAFIVMFTKTYYYFSLPFMVEEKQKLMKKLWREGLGRGGQEL